MATQEQKLEALEAQKRDIEDKIEAYRLELKKVNSLIAEVKKESINWVDLISRLFSQIEEPVTTDEILQIIFHYEPEELTNQFRRRNYMMQLSFSLNRLCAKDEIGGKPESGYKGKFYYPKDWEDENGELKPLYRQIYEEKKLKVKAIKNKSSGF